jgi:cytochrome P450
MHIILFIIMYPLYRLNPVAIMNARVLDQDIVLSGYHVPAKV